MPMAYGLLLRPGQPHSLERPGPPGDRRMDLRRLRDVVLKWGFRPPLYPILGPYHDEYGSAPMSPDEFRVWLDRLAAYGPTFVSFYTARAIADPLAPLIRDFAPAEAPVEMPVPAAVWMRPAGGGGPVCPPGLRGSADTRLVYRATAEGVAWRRGATAAAGLQVRTADGALSWLPERRADDSAAFALADPGAPPTLPAPPPPRRAT